MTSWNGSRSRITPAWAGKSQWAMTCYSGQQGSPPRGRGKGIVGSLHHALDGITPAWAGKSIEKPFQFLSQLDHPRVGGEKPRFFDTPDDTVGSPPRGRGKVECGLQLAFHIGITPAWAGKSDLLFRRAEIAKDHPRVGGEKKMLRSASSSHSGSPPRGRGKARRFSKSFSSARITPAWAGKSGQPRQPCQQPWDHPRVGGEKVFADSPSQKVQGSPPRGRGKEVKTRKSGDPTGITPAWAGKSHSALCLGRFGGDHPRVGGEKLRFGTLL